VKRPSLDHRCATPAASPMIDQKYKDWINEQYPIPMGAAGMCATATKRMIEAFPELTRVRGWVNGHEHWWCVDAAGVIVDPTAHQWTWTVTPDMYQPFVDGVHEEAIGRCMNCGDYCFASVAGADTNACSESCQRALRDYYM